MNKNEPIKKIKIMVEIWEDGTIRDDETGVAIAVMGRVHDWLWDRYAIPEVEDEQ